MNYPPSSTSAVDTALSLAHLSEYAHTLDSLPIDLSKSYGDLRELDAVLSSSMTLLTTKINDLISMIETKTGSNDERLFLLNDIAEEAYRLKLGGEDKIRVACHAADGLRAHRAHMKALLDCMPEKEFSRVADALSRKTVFPHVATRHFYPPGMVGEGGRRNRRAAGAANGYGPLVVNGADPSPTKRKRATKEDEIDVTRTPTKKERLDAPVQRRGNGARPKKVIDRVASPTESILSVASHMPQNVPVQTSTGPSRPAGPGRAGSNGANKRAQDASRRDAFAAQPPPASHPSLPAPHASAQIGVLTDAHGARAMSNGVVSEWPHGQLEGPGMPVARNFQPPADPADGMSAEPDGDVDDNKTYCFCDGVSYGEMIGCDDEECEREWFHLACVGLTTPPEGGWYCETCTARRQGNKRSARGGKKRSAGRTAARSHPA
ncbi:hypothetical protein L227DRAFT_571266 [Lentinus tigrinus ALCF2SS1-6]|uniref:Chromatin modification-related protein n=2 Tax=Lentinus tigrinus TaxID=5365 RepID=A0A5C2SLU9_9APHY|nr:hypothetical protein L227DRAFT_571266 [Lentinus tigrinus ALCF2SS1-6]